MWVRGQWRKRYGSNMSILLLLFLALHDLQYYEPLQFHYGHASSLELRLTGEGVEPSVALRLEGEVLHDTLDMGHAFSGDTITKVLQVSSCIALWLDSQF